MDNSEFDEGVNALKNKKIVIVGCGAQGLNQGLNMRDSGLNISYALRQEAISQKRDSFKNATSNNFEVGTFEELIPKADMVLNLTPDKNHTNVVNKLMPLMKENSTFLTLMGLTLLKKVNKFIKISPLLWWPQNPLALKLEKNIKEDLEFLL